MQQTFQINTAELDSRFIESVKEIFGERKLKIIVEDIAESVEYKDALLDSLFGSWESEETGEELVKMIYSSRNDSPRDIEL
jgi:16S rRNA A1518/A1519 N6-dimethyltransferase RsmA/KsgA/DIM1 with predicted DNA glycosylase/AP lyase activity